MTYLKQTMGTTNNTSETVIRKPMLADWKINQALTWGILLITLLSSYFYYQLLQQQFERMRKLAGLSDQQLIRQLQSSSTSQLKQLASTIAAQQNIIQSIAADNTQQLSSMFDQFGEQLLATTQVDYLGFYRLNQQPLAIWTDKTSDRGLSQQINRWLNEVDLSGNNQSIFFCLINCRYYLVTALQLNQKKVGYLVVSISFTRLLNQLDLPANRIISILSPAHNRETSTDTMVYKWGYTLHPGTGDVHAEKILREFSKKYASINAEQPLLSSFSFQRFYQLAFYPVQRADNSYLIILDDISDSMFALFRGCLIFALAVFSVLLLIQLMFNRKIRLLNLPTAGDSAQQALVENSTSTASGFRPETSYTTLQQLETLKKYNQDVNLELAHQMICLSHEKSLLNNILDQTHAIIMTLQSDGSIQSVNGFGEKISGYSAAQLSTKKFTELYPDNSTSATDDQFKIVALASGEISDFQHEAHLKVRDKTDRIIMWQHSRLPVVNAEAPLILSTGIDISDIKKLERNLSWLINYDALTSLFNRRRFENELDAALIWAKNNHSDGTLLTIDLDNFKDINDACGHKVGDIILRKVASTLKVLTREFYHSSNIISARLGGDEFAIILRNIDQDGAIQLAKRIIKALNNISHMHRQVSFQLSSSIGIATFSGAENIPNDLLSNANFARNQAKIEGRNQFHTFKAEHSHLEKTHYRMFWREKIENALKTDGFILHFQPILNIHHSTISHYETLLRMSDDNNELVTPALFIDIAEKFGLIQQIDSFIIAAAIAKQGALRRNGHDVTLAINLSSRAFDDPELFNKIQRAITSSHANPEHLIFEITETGEVSNIVEAKQIMTHIQSLGCKFSLDDFGIGFSSFYHLRKLPFEYVKIDGSFVHDLANNSDNQILVQALSEVAIGFNKLTVAEFVDSTQTLEILKQAKVNYAQGYLIGKPSEKIPVDEPDFYKSRRP